VVLSDVNQLINAHDRYNECLKRVGVIGVPNVISISTAEKLREVAKATGKQVRRRKPNGCDSDQETTGRRVFL